MVALPLQRGLRYEEKVITPARRPSAGERLAGEILVLKVPLASVATVQGMCEASLFALPLIWTTCKFILAERRDERFEFLVDMDFRHIAGNLLGQAVPGGSIALGADGHGAAEPWGDSSTLGAQRRRSAHCETPTHTATLLWSVV
jgi:hypothetical protein